MINPNKKNTKIIVVVLGIFLLVGIIILVWPRLVGNSGEQNIRNEIEQARQCETKNDCALVQSQCPFGCFVSVNKTQAERISSLIQAYQSNCIYGCIEVKEVDCIDNQCSVILPQQ